MDAHRYPPDGGLKEPVRNLSDSPSAMRIIMDAYEVGLREQMQLDDSWSYRPIQWMKNSFFDRMVKIIGEDNVKFVTLMEKGPGKRGSMFINQQGLENLRNFVDTEEDEE